MREVSGLALHEEVLLDILAGRRRDFPDTLLDSRVECDGLVRLCRTHAVHLLVANLVKGGREPIKPQADSLVAELERDYDERCAALLAADAQIGTIGRALNGRGIKPVILKGLALVHTLYEPAPATRCFGDIDILVPESTYKETIDVFLGAGYRLAEHKRDIEAIRHYGHKLSFESGGPGPFGFDVHFRPVGKKLFDASARIDESVFMKGCVERTVCGASVMFPSPEMHFVYLCIHLSVQHHLASLGWLCDIRAFAASATLDWEAVVRIVEECRAGRAVWLSMLAARDILDAPVPNDVLEMVLPGRIGMFERPWFSSMLDAGNILAQVHHYRQKSLPGKVSRMFSEVLMIDRQFDRASGVGRWMFPDPMFLRVSYRVSGWLKLMLCYLVHPFVVAFVCTTVILLTAKYAAARFLRLGRRCRK